jgi:hypothetical protein
MVDIAQLNQHQYIQYARHVAFEMREKQDHRVGGHVVLGELTAGAVDRSWLLFAFGRSYDLTDL